MVPKTHHKRQSTFAEHAPPSDQALRVYIVSDVHMNTQPYEPDTETENPSRKHFREFLTQLNDEPTPGKTMLILNGDVIDINGSWYDARMPWDTDQTLVAEELINVVREILENNNRIMNELRRFLQQPNTEVIYIIGNHDRLLSVFPQSQQFIREQLSPDNIDRFRFAPFLEVPELSLYVEHGQRLDPFNSVIKPGVPPFGDIVNIRIVNRFVDNVITEMTVAGYSNDVIRQMQSALDDLEYIRPLSLGPYWIQSVLEQFRSNPEIAARSQFPLLDSMMHDPKTESIDSLIHRIGVELLFDKALLKIISQRFHLPPFIFRTLFRMMLRFPTLLPVLSLLVTSVRYKAHFNQKQRDEAQKLKDKGYAFIVFGHTHVPDLVALNEHSYYFNTGSWKPVINLFKRRKGDSVLIESLRQQSLLNKIERSAVVKLEYDAALPNQPARFEIITKQLGAG